MLRRLIAKTPGIQRLFNDTETARKKWPERNKAISAGAPRLEQSHLPVGRKVLGNIEERYSVRVDLFKIDINHFFRNNSSAFACHAWSGRIPDETGLLRARSYDAE